MSTAEIYEQAVRMAEEANERDKSEGILWTAEDWRYWVSRFFYELGG